MPYTPLFRSRSRSPSAISRRTPDEDAEALVRPPADPDHWDVCRLAFPAAVMLTPRQQNAYHRARTLITGDRLAEAASMLVDIASPTGAEGPLARAVVARLTGPVIAAQDQSLDARQSQAFAILHGPEHRPSLTPSAPHDPTP